MVNVPRRSVLQGSIAACTTGLLAGCTGAASTPDDGSGSEEPTLDDVPGVDGGRIETRSEFAAHHGATVREQSATRTGTITGTPLAAGDGRGTVHTETHVDGDRFFHRIVDDDPAVGPLREEYVDGRDHYVAVREDDEWDADHAAALGGGRNRRWLTGETTITRLGEPLTLVGTDGDGERFRFTRDAGDPDDGEDGDAGETDRAELLLDGDGVCHEFLHVVSPTGESVSPPRRVVEWSLSDLGATAVEPPAWVEQIE